MDSTGPVPCPANMAHKLQSAHRLRCNARGAATATRQKRAFTFTSTRVEFGMAEAKCRVADNFCRNMYYSSLRIDVVTQEVMATKLTTVIVNESRNGLIMKVGNHHHFARLGSVKLGGEFKLQVDLNWTYQEFLLEDTTDATKKVVVNSDDCYDYERITVAESAVDVGKLDVVTVPRTVPRTSVDTASSLNIITRLLANSMTWLISGNLLQR